jgi:hypothetical protein
MPFEITIQPGSAIVRVRVFGAATIEEILQAREEATAGPDVSPDLPVLIDAREMTSVLGLRGVRELAHEFVTRPIGTGRRAFVATEDAVYGMMRMLVTLSTGTPNQWRVFRTIEQAEEWLSE